ncbi:hypothetical protein [uncultured Clostridium sp.]|uniref:hypothetical protein n=1 Tax=uncultured Clostridium sp. TaxID=59620 RepID=UPI0026F177CB|nr:hypothetical protein [uncultured Clostridium sp.]
MEREFRVKDIINLVLDRLRQEGLYFATKDDQGYASAKNLYKLDEEGLLEEKTVDKIVDEVISYIGDGAVFMIDAVNQWIVDGITEGKLGYIDTLNMEFDDNGIINGDLSIYNQIGQEELNVDVEPKEEEIAQEAEKEETKKKKKTESKSDIYYNVILNGPSGKDTYDQVDTYKEAVISKNKGQKEFPNCEFKIVKMSGNIPANQKAESKKVAEGFFKGPEVKASELKIGDTYIDMRGDLNKVLDRPMPEKDLGIMRKQLTKMLMPNQQDIKGTEWKLDRIRRATDDDFEKYPHIVSENKKVTENYKVTNIEWDTEDNGETVSAKELGLPEEVEIPAHIEENDIADYLSDKYEYCVLDFDIVGEDKKVEAKVDGVLTDIPDELMEPTPEPSFSKRDWNIYYNRCMKDYTDVYNGDSTTKISFLQNKAKQLGLGDLEFSDNSWKEDINSIAKAYADNKVGKMQESRVHMQLQKGDRFVNEKGVEIEIIDVDKEHLLDGQPQVTYRFSGNTTNKDSYCYKMDSVVSTINQNRYKKVEEKKTLQEGKRQRLNEENSKSKDLINSMVTARDFDSDSTQGQIILRTQELFNVLSDRGYDVQVTFDNGESQSVIMLGNQGGSILITITNTNQPLRAFTSGNFEITDDSIQILNDIKEQITAL